MVDAVISSGTKLVISSTCKKIMQAWIDRYTYWNISSL